MDMVFEKIGSCQKYLPKIYKGDKRVFLINGKLYASGEGIFTISFVTL